MKTTRFWSARCWPPAQPRRSISTRPRQGSHRAAGRRRRPARARRNGKSTPDATAPSKPNVLKQSGQATYPVCLKDDTNLKDGFVEVKFKAISGKEDQAGGLVWRAKDANNYYVARANALENNVTIYHTINGRRTEKKRVRMTVAANQWHTLRVEFQAQPLHGELQRPEGARLGRRDVQGCRQGGRVDEGRQRDGSSMTSRMPRNSRLALSAVDAVRRLDAAAMACGGRTEPRVARGDGVRVGRPAVLRADHAGVRAAIGRPRQRRLRHGGDEVDRPGQPAAGGEGAAAGRRVLVERAGSNAGAEIARRARARTSRRRRRASHRRSRIPTAIGPASRRGCASSSTTRTRSRQSDAPRRSSIWPIRAGRGRSRSRIRASARRRSTSPRCTRNSATSAPTSTSGSSRRTTSRSSTATRSSATWSRAATCWSG